VQTHWDARDADAVPYACQSHGSLEFREYPFVNPGKRLRDDLFAARPNEIRQDVDLVLFIEGERGCVVDGGNINPATRVDIANGYRVNCPAPEGSSWECVGEGCHPPLPGIRLPGNDIEVRQTPGEGWDHCQQRCNDNTDCRAWTWRRASTSGPGSPETCLLKSQAGTQIHDSCCESGIKP
jgi:PAN domain